MTFSKFRRFEECSAVDSVRVRRLYAPTSSTHDRECQGELNALIAKGTSAAEAMRLVSNEPGAFEEAPSSPPPVAAARPPWRGDSTDWSGIVEKIDKLRSLDRGLAVFGARRHQYLLAPVASERTLLALERKWKVPLPPGLRAFYTNVGNGGAGPGYGLFPVTSLKRFKVATPYAGVEALRARVPPGAAPANPLLAPLRPSQRTGMLAVADFGCGIFSAVVCTGDVGRVVAVDEDGLSETDQTLVAEVHRWLDEHITCFELVSQLRTGGASRDETVQALVQTTPHRSPARARFDVDTALQGLSG